MSAFGISCKNRTPRVLQVFVSGFVAPRFSVAAVDLGVDLLCRVKNEALSSLRQIPVHKHHRHRALTHRRRATLH